MFAFAIVRFNMSPRRFWVLIGALVNNDSEFSNSSPVLTAAPGNFPEFSTRLQHRSGIGNYLGVEIGEIL